MLFFSYFDRCIVLYRKEKREKEKYDINWIDLGECVACMYVCMC